MPVRPMLLHRMALDSSRLFCKNLGNLQEFFGQMVYRPPWPKIARTPMWIVFVCFKGVLFWLNLTTKVAEGHALSSRGKSPAPGP